MIGLKPLSGEDSASMAEQMLAASGFALPLRSLIAAKGEGNPFYIEELVRSLGETGAMRATAAGYELSGESTRWRFSSRCRT
jgi:predicted ATPase